MMTECSALSDFNVPGTSINIKMSGFPSLVDGKTKIFWSGSTHGSKSCWVCYAYGGMLAKDFRGMPQFEPKDLINLMFGFGQCHMRIRAFDYLKKFAYNKDFKHWECRYIHINLQRNKT